MRRLNLKFLSILVVGMALFGGGMYLVHGVQVQRNAKALLETARQAEADKQLEKAEDALSWYVSLRPDDGEAWARYARIVDQGDPDRRRITRSFVIHQQALLHAPTDDLKRRCADLAMEIGRFSEAKQLLDELRRRVEGDSKETAAQAELEDLIGQCDRGLGNSSQAEKSFRDAITHDPHRVDTYKGLALLCRSELRQDTTADETIRNMVAKNPETGRAYAYRWQYAREFPPQATPKEIEEALALPSENRKILVADPKDIEQAVSLAPEDGTVLLIAAIASEQKRDLAAMRTHLEKGHKLDVKNPLFALYLARLESAEGHFDRGAAVLRESFQARPNFRLAFDLADNLISRQSQQKSDVKDGAAFFMSWLRAAGLGETLVRFLEARTRVQQNLDHPERVGPEEWKKAIDDLERVRAVLVSAQGGVKEFVRTANLVRKTDVMLAQCYGRQGLDEERLDALRQAAEGDQGQDVDRLVLAGELARSGQIDQAISTFSPVVLAGRNPAWRLTLVRLLFQKTMLLPPGRRNWNELEQHLSEAEKAMPGTAETVLLRGTVLAAQGKLDDAHALLTQVLAKDPANLDFRLAMAHLIQLQGRGGEALTLIDQAEKDLGRMPQIALARLDYWGRQGGDAARAAVAKLAAAREQVPAADRPTFLDRLGAVAIRLGRPDLARQYWRELADLQPNNLQARLGLFDLAIQAGDREEPARLVSEIHEIDGELGSNWRFVKAALLLDQARRGSSDGLEEARRLVAEITSRRPTWWVGPTLNGEIAELEGSVDQAITHYLKGLELGNVQPSFARKLVMLLEQQGRRDDVERVTQVLRDQGAALAEITIVRALEAIRQKDFKRGLDLASEVFREDSPNSADHLILGRIYQAAGQGDRAGREFRRAVELGRGTPESWLAYVEYLVQARQIDQARAVIGEARKVLPADRATVTLAKCLALVGDRKQSDIVLQEVLNNKDRPADPTAIQLAIASDLAQGRAEAAKAKLDQLDGLPAATLADRAWAQQTRIMMLLSTGRRADQDRALALVENDRSRDVTSAGRQELKARILAMQPARHGEAIRILESLEAADRLGVDARFELARLYLAQGDLENYQDEMHKLLDVEVKEPRHLAHFVNHCIDRNELDQADRWLAELKKVASRGLPALTLEARLLDARKRKPEICALLQARGREIPDQIGPVADLLDYYGFVGEAESAYRAFVARDSRQPERALALAAFLGRRDRVPEAMDILRKTWSVCSPDRVALVALLLFDLPSVTDAQRKQVEAWIVALSQKRPDLVSLSDKLATLWIRQGRVDEAEALLRRILGSHPDDPEALNNLAWVLALRDASKTQQALEHIDRAIEIQGRNASLLDTRAVVLIRSGQIDSAIEMLNEARKLDERKSSVALHLARAYQSQRRTTEALQEFRQAVKLGWKPENCDPLERAFIDKLPQELGGS